jgi:hypothetical protein
MVRKLACQHEGDTEGKQGEERATHVDQKKDKAESHDISFSVYIDVLRNKTCKNHDETKFAKYLGWPIHTIINRNLDVS